MSDRLGDYRLIERIGTGAWARSGGRGFFVPNPQKLFTQQHEAIQTSSLATESVGCGTAVRPI